MSVFSPVAGLESGQLNHQETVPFWHSFIRCLPKNERRTSNIDKNVKINLYEQFCFVSLCLGGHFSGVSVSGSLDTKNQAPSIPINIPAATSDG